MHGRQIQKYQNEKSFHSPDVTTVTSVLGILKNTRAQQFVSLSMHHNYLEGIRRQIARLFSQGFHISRSEWAPVIWISEQS